MLSAVAPPGWPWPPTTISSPAARGRAGPARVPVRPASAEAGWHQGWPPGWPTRAGGPGGRGVLLPRVRDHRGAAAVLRRPGHPGRGPPQGRQRPRRPAHRGRAAVPAAATSPSRCRRRRLAAGALPGDDPNGHAARRCCATPRARRCTVRSRLPEGGLLAAQVWVAQVGRVPLLLLDSYVEENDADLSGGHRPAVRRRQRAPAPPGAAARRRRHAGGARLLRADRAPVSPRCSTPTRGTPGSSAWSGSASLPSAACASTRPRGRCRAGHGVHHAHPGAGRHRPVPPRAGASTIRRPAHAGLPASTGCWRSARRPTRAGIPACSIWRSWACGWPSRSTASRYCTAR